MDFGYCLGERVVRPIVDFDETIEIFSLSAWYGALEYKETYMRHFMKQETESLRNETYDTSKLVKLLDELIAEASRLCEEV